MADMTLATFELEIQNQLNQTNRYDLTTLTEVKKVFEDVKQLFRERGLHVCLSTSELSTFNLNDSHLAIVADYGIFLYEATGPTDNINTFPALVGGRYRRILAIGSGSVDTSTLVPKTTTVNAKALSSSIVLSTADIADSLDKRYVTDAQRSNIGNQSGVNTGNETKTSIQNALGVATASNSGYLSATDWGRFNAAVLNYSAENSANKDVDGTMASNSDVKYPSQKAVRTYVAAQITQVNASGGIVVDPTPTANSTNAVQSGGTFAALSSKVDKVVGMGLSSNDYTATEKTKLTNIANNATANSTDAQLRDRSTHTGTQLAATISDFANAARLAFTAGANISISNTGVISSTAANSGINAIQEVTSGTTININTASDLVINPATTLNTFAAVLPPSPQQGQVCYIMAGGALTSGPVVNTLSISPSAGQTVLQPFVLSTLNAGESIGYKNYNNVWRRIA